MTTTTDMRAAFEAWANREGFNTERDDSEKYREYHRTTTRWAWLAWQAAYAAGRNAKREPLSDKQEREAFQVAMAQAGYHRAVANARGDGWLFERDADRWVGWQLARAHGIGADHKEDAA